MAADMVVRLHTVDMEVEAGLVSLPTAVMEADTAVMEVEAGLVPLHTAVMDFQAAMVPQTITRIPDRAILEGQLV